MKVAEGGSFSKAAKSLFLTQPTISAHISSLERELNVRLFVRNTKEVILSEQGKVLYEYARQMVELQNKITEIFFILTKVPSPTKAVNVPGPKTSSKIKSLRPSKILLLITAL